MNISHNTFAISPAKKPAVRMPSWCVTNSGDGRLRLAMLLGDGFFQGFLADMGCSEEIRCSVNDLIPGQGVAKFPKESNWSESSLWSPQVWPRLANFVSEYGTSGFFEAIATHGINAGSSGVGFDMASVQYEYRCYLWFYFRWVNDTLWSNLAARDIRWNDWAFFESASQIVKGFNVDIVSFNYDTLVQMFVQGCKAQFHIADFADLSSMWGGVPCHVPSIVAVHGSLQQGYDFPGLPKEHEIWKSGLRAGYNRVDHRFFGKVGPGDRLPPTAPTIIPPGCMGSDVTIPTVNSVPNAKYLLSNADVVLVYGLSGLGVDENEVTKLLAVIPDNATVIHVGLPENDKESTPVARWRLRLEESGRRAHFVSGKNLKVLESLLQECLSSWDSA